MFNPETPPELVVTRWLNTKEPVTLKAHRGKVVVLLAFQMLCPSCVEKALPLARKLSQRFNPEQVAVIALHTVFENHDVMTEKALQVFQKEYNWPFPIGIDKPDGVRPPKTFATYQMQGTPSLLVFDRAGRLRRHYFGHPDEMMIAAEVMSLAIEDADGAREQAAAIERKLAAITTIITSTAMPAVADTTTATTTITITTATTITTMATIMAMRRGSDGDGERALAALSRSGMDRSELDRLWRGRDR
jgi:thiol-disulfide isomerase/thioredoxin